MINRDRIRKLFVRGALMMNNLPGGRLLLPSVVFIIIGVALVVGIGVGIVGWSVGAGQAISVGETVSGVITSGGSDEWTFEGTAGQVGTINLYATPGSGLDAYLISIKPSGAEYASDDDGGTNYNSRIQRSLYETGTYTIVARGHDGRPVLRPEPTNFPWKSESLDL